MNKQLQPVLEVENVSKAFGGVEALKKGSMKLFPGEVLAIVGANGAGKSTLFNALTNSSKAQVKLLKSIQGGLMCVILLLFP